MYFRKMENVLGCDSNFILDVVNFSYPLDWVTGCEDICYTLLGGVSVMLFPDEIKIEIGRLSKADGPPQGQWVSFSRLTEGSLCVLVWVSMGPACSVCRARLRLEWTSSELGPLALWFRLE